MLGLGDMLLWLHCAFLRLCTCASTKNMLSLLSHPEAVGDAHAMVFKLVRQHLEYQDSHIYQDVSKIISTYTRERMEQLCDSSYLVLPSR